MAQSQQDPDKNCEQQIHGQPRQTDYDNQLTWGLPGTIFATSRMGLTYYREEFVTERFGFRQGRIGLTLRRRTGGR